MDTTGALKKYIESHRRPQHWDRDPPEGVLDKDAKAKHLYLGYVVDPPRFHEQDEQSRKPLELDEEVLDFSAETTAEPGKKRKAEPSSPAFAKKKKHKAAGTLMNEIANMLSGLRDVLPFLVTADFPQFEFVRLKSKTNGGDALPANPADLLPRCAPSPYGDLKTHSTKVDTDVRLAFEILAADLVLTEQACRFLDDFASFVSELLFGGRPLRLELSKLNVYPFKGHFRAHIDTPLEGMLGTVLVELPYRYVGGEFKIAEHKAAFKTHPVQLEAVNALDESTKGKPADRMRSLAFFGHCPHQVLEVKMGVRVTLAFCIKERKKEGKQQVAGEGQEERKQSKAKAKASGRKPKGVAAKSKQKTGKDENVEMETEQPKAKEPQAGCRLLQSASFDGVAADIRCFASAQEGKGKSVDIAGTVARIADAAAQILAEEHAQPLGILLSHKYSKSEHDRGHLKGADAYLLPIDMLPVAVEHLESTYHDPGCMERPEQTVYRMTERDVLALLGKGRFDVNPYMEVEFVGNMQDWKLVAEYELDYESDCEYTGNTDAPGVVANQYFTTAVILDPGQLRENKGDKHGGGKREKSKQKKQSSSSTSPSA